VGIRQIGYGYLEQMEQNKYGVDWQASVERSNVHFYPTNAGNFSPNGTGVEKNCLVLLVENRLHMPYFSTEIVLITGGKRVLGKCSRRREDNIKTDKMKLKIYRIGPTVGKW
jgi:hypothetical protein